MPVKPWPISFYERDAAHCVRDLIPVTAILSAVNRRSRAD